MVEFESDCFLPLNEQKHSTEIGGKVFVGYTIKTKKPSLGDEDAECLLLNELRELRVSVVLGDSPDVIKEIMKEKRCDLCGLIGGFRRPGGGSLDFK